MEGGKTNNYKFIIDCMKGMTDGIDPRKVLFDLINFDGSKVVQVVGDILELYCPNFTCMLCTLHGEKQMLQGHRKFGVGKGCHQVTQAGTLSVWW